ncbi:unnamed protein product [Caenorhabditis angaria]|uniref:DNA2/NAM7 helicase-like C-terminal domain-containing protein n=1 Tax=Caenorhabditis angaria TaxID=860376 RepID=A0A9P1N557_9PELO|nr:unnamed protein product [Caenorhabditis angaria]
MEEDPLKDLLRAYSGVEAINAPDQSIEDILQFRKCYKNPQVEVRTRDPIIRFDVNPIMKCTNEDFEKFRNPYAFYRIDKIRNSNVLCYPFYFETAFEENYKHLLEIHLNLSSKDLLVDEFSTIHKLLVGDIVAISDIYSFSNQYYAGEYIVFERRIETSDALIYLWNYRRKQQEYEQFVASSLNIPMNRGSAHFVEKPIIEELKNMQQSFIGRCNIFIPVEGTQKFAANLEDDIFHPDERKKIACQKLHKYSHKYLYEFAINHYPPLVIHWQPTSSFNNERFTSIDSILQAKNQKNVLKVSSIIEASLTHFENMKNWLDIRNHPLKICSWKIIDPEDYLIEIKFKVGDSAWERYFPKKAMLRVYGITKPWLDMYVVGHLKKISSDRVGLTCHLRIIDNIDESKEINVESIGRKLYDEVCKALNDEPQLIYTHLIPGDTRNFISCRPSKKQMPKDIFEEIMHYSRNDPPVKFEYEICKEEKIFIKNELRKLINNEPTKEQTQSVYFSIHSRNPIMSIEAPVGGGKTTLLSSICCISSIFYDKCQLIVSESNGAIVSVCRKLKEFGAQNVIRITSSVAQKRNGNSYLTDFDLPTVAERVFANYLMDYDQDPDKTRSKNEFELLARTYRMLNYMHQTVTQTNFNFKNFEKLREQIGYSIDSAPEDPSNEQIRLVFKLWKPKIILGTITQIGQLIENEKIKLKLEIDRLYIDKCSVESLFSVCSIVSTVCAGCSEKNNYPKIIMIGDSEQFKPFCDNPAISSYFQTSMTIIGKGIAQVKHDQMFRCQPDTSNLLKKIFYLKEPSTNSRDLCKSIVFNLVAPDETNQIYEERFMKNWYEVKEIMKKCKELEENGMKKEDIMILAFYNGQVNLLKKHLPGYTVLTVRSCQGLEAKVVLVTVARTKYWELVFFDPEQPMKTKLKNRRMSSEHLPITAQREQILVALSRAKEKCFVFIDPEYLEMVQLWRNIHSLCE